MKIKKVTENFYKKLSKIYFQNQKSYRKPIKKRIEKLLKINAKNKKTY